MQDYFQFVFEGINELLNQHSGLFEALGMNLLRGFGVIVLSWFGIQAALTSAGGGPGPNWGKFFGLVQDLLLVYTILTFYTIPLPMAGVSFTHLILDQVQYMVGVLNETRIQELFDSLNTIESNLPYPSPLELLQIFRFIIADLCIMVAQAVILYVVMYGYVATAVIVLIGPLFVPFKILPQMEWMFWSWLRAFIQYAFYQLIASAYVFIFGHFLLVFLGSTTGPLSNEDMGYLFFPLVMTLITFTLGTIKIPALTFSLFSGRSGDYVLGRWR